MLIHTQSHSNRCTTEQLGVNMDRMSFLYHDDLKDLPDRMKQVTPRSKETDESQSMSLERVKKPSLRLWYFTEPWIEPLSTHGENVEQV